MRSSNEENVSYICGWSEDDVKSIQYELLKEYIRRNSGMKNPPKHTMNGLDFRSCLLRIRQSCIDGGGSDDGCIGTNVDGIMGKNTDG